MVLPEGTVTFLFTDLEGSTRLLERDRDLADRALTRHHVLLTDAVRSHGGVVFETVGDAAYAAFAEPGAAVSGALAAQRAMAGEDWAAAGPLRIRVALHRGAVERRGQRYFGTALFGAARLLALAHGGQTLVSDDLAAVLPTPLPDGGRLTPLGRHRLKDLARPMVVHQLSAPGLPDDFAPLRSLGVVHLPAQPTPCLGREVEVAAVRGLLARGEARLLTLTGPGGIGKTRLALEAAGGLGEVFPDGVWWVPVAGVGEPSGVLPAIAAATGATGPPAGHLETWRALLLMDNLEHVIEAAGDVATLLAACPELAILATSREPLRVAAERRHEVLPLARPQCVALLRLHADAIRPGLTVAEADADAICDSLDDLPLAVELAAARLNVLGPADVRARLARRLDALGPAGRDRPDRQRTLRAAIGWSVDLLSEPERDAYARLAVFADSWTAEAAEVVCGVDLDTLAALVDRSLVRVEPDSRFGMLFTIRDDARERLSARPDADDLHHGHAEWVAGHVGPLSLADRDVQPGAMTAYQEWMRVHEAEVWAAIEWADGPRHGLLLHTLVAGGWWYLSDHGGGARLLALARRTDWDALAAPEEHLLDARWTLGEMERYFGDPDRAIAIKLRETQHLAARGDPRMMAAVHADLADLLARQGQLLRAGDHAREALRLRHEIGEPALVAHALAARIIVVLALGDLPAAVQCAREAWALVTGSEPMYRAYIGEEAARALSLVGEGPDAAFVLREIVEVAERFDLGLTRISALESTATLAERRGDRAFAAWLLGAREAAASRLSATDVDPAALASLESHLRHGPDAAHLARMRSSGQEATPEAAARAALDWLAATFPAAYEAGGG